MVLASGKVAAPLLELRRVSKAFGGVQALDGVSLTLNGGEILALVGENGAGKSTLMRVLAGVHAPDAGELLLDGERLSLSGPRDAMAVGIGLIHQELCLCDNLSVMENIVLGREPRRRGLVDRAAMQEVAEGALARVGLEVSPRALVESLPLGQQQLVEVAKALSLDARILVFDEPTSALTESEAAHLMEVVRGLRGEGVAVVWISHRLREVVALADRAVALRDGSNSGSLEASEMSREALVAAMVGRDLGDLFVRESGNPGPVALAVTGLRTEAWPEAAVDLEVREGEIVGLAGLVGAGRSELLETLAGVRHPLAGQVTGSAAPVLGSGVADAVARGVALIEDERRGLRYERLDQLLVEHLLGVRG